MRVKIADVDFYLGIYNANKRDDMPAYHTQRVNGNVNIVEYDIEREGYCVSSHCVLGLTTREAYYVAMGLANSVRRVR